VTPATVLVASQTFAGGLDGHRVARAIGRGLRAGKPGLGTDLCPLEALDELPQELPKDFDRRMRSSRAVVIAAECLDHETLLRGGGVFEVATRARQAGVPCYAVAGSDGLDPFEARILDLQVVLEASGERGLAAAGRKLAGIM
jgi:glycerate kinase